MRVKPARRDCCGLVQRRENILRGGLVGVDDPHRPDAEFSQSWGDALFERSAPAVLPVREDTALSLHVPTSTEEEHHVARSPVSALDLDSEQSLTGRRKRLPCDGIDLEEFEVEEVSFLRVRLHESAGALKGSEHVRLQSVVNGGGERHLALWLRVLVLQVV
jgi:hypothetical protein